jgi:undecaprenyl-diphosphatase
MEESMTLMEAVLLGLVEGVTEFLPVSSTGHLTIAEGALGLDPSDPGITAFTAVIQLGAILAVVSYFRADIARFATAWVRGIRDPEVGRTAEARMGWYVILGSVPIALVGFAAHDVISGSLRGLTVVGVALIAWSGVMVFAEARARQHRGEDHIGPTDALVIGGAQCLALIPGVSRSGATISAGLACGLDRVAATRVSFLLAIPALVAAGGYEALTARGFLIAAVGWPATLLATGVSFVVAYASIAWLLRFVAHRPISLFAGYRVALGLLVLIAVAV